MSSPVRVAVTGAAGQISYALLFRIAAGNLLGPKQPVILQLLEITPALKALQGAGIQAAWNVHETGAEAVLTGNVGPNAFAMLDALGIKVYVGVTGTVQDAIRQFKAGELEAAEAPNVEPHWA